ncbi:Alg9-like mannosyltransferase [Hamiltosporidium magnivora]|uniref:Mannosyltransferase n=1 Tax=Hamiltosporidium magnivora TaxID=148818 RepID=A0A4Q9L4D4_9MICR|nr:Alg9-like mannosyltransferase [Hamiltosporidium magnivora]
MIGIRSVNYVLVYFIPLYFFKIFSDVFRFFCLVYIRNNFNIFLFLNFIFLCLLCCFTVVLCFFRLTDSGRFLINEKTKNRNQIINCPEDDVALKCMGKKEVLKIRKTNFQNNNLERFGLRQIIGFLSHINILNNLYLVVLVILESKYQFFDEMVVNKYGYLVSKIVNGIIAGLADYLIIKLGTIYKADEDTLIYVTALSHGLWLYSPRSHINSFELFMAVLCLYALETFKTPTIPFCVCVLFSIYNKKNLPESNNLQLEKLECNETNNNDCNQSKDRTENVNPVTCSKLHSIVNYLKLVKVCCICLYIIRMIKNKFVEAFFKIRNIFCSKTDSKIDENLKKSANEKNIDFNNYKECFYSEKDNEQLKLADNQVNYKQDNKYNHYEENISYNDAKECYKPEDKSNDYKTKESIKDTKNKDIYKSDDTHGQSKIKGHIDTEVSVINFKINDFEDAEDLDLYNRYGRRVLSIIMVFIKNIPRCLFLVLLMALVDSYFYKELTFVPFVFFNVNVRWSISEVFGEQHVLSYVWFFIVLTGFIGTFLFLNFNANQNIAIFVLIYLIFYSALKHKEMRFIVPVIPFCNLLCAISINKMSYRNTGGINYIRKKLYSGVLYIDLYITFFIGLYIGLVHQNTFDISFFMKTEVEKILTESFFAANTDLDFYKNKNIKNSERNKIEISVDFQNVLVYSFICYENVNIKSVSRNPDITVKMKDLVVCKRFDGQKVIFYEYEMYMDLLEATSESYKTQLESKKDKNNKIDNDKIVDEKVEKEMRNNNNRDDTDNAFIDKSINNSFEGYDYILIYKHIFEKYSNVFYEYEIINTFKYIHVLFEEEKRIYMLVLKSKKYNNHL